MNIGIFADCYEPTISGVVTSVLQLKEGLEQRGHRAIVVTVNTPRYDNGDPAVYDFPSLPFNSDSGFRLGLVSQRSIDRIVREEQLDLIHTHTEYSLGWAGRRAARGMGLPLIHSAHTMHQDYRHYLFFGRMLPVKAIRWLLKRFLLVYDALVCPSKKARDYLKPLVPELPTVVIGNGIARSWFCPGSLAQGRGQARHALGVRPADKVICYAGRLAKEKRVLELLVALVPLLRSRPHLKALFVGTGPALDSLARVADRSGVRRQIILTGGVAWRRMHRLYALADLFVTASLSEIHPMTLIEASMCGLPIVARRDTAYAGLVRDDYNGYLVDSDQQLAERAAEILDDEAKRLRLARNGLLLSEEFTAERYVERLEALYQQVIANSSLSKG